MPLLQRGTPLQWVSAVLAAAALAFLPALVLIVGRDTPTRPNEALVVYGGGFLAVALIAAHALLSRERGTLLVSVMAGTLNALALVGVFIMLLFGGSCSDDGHVPQAAWIAAAVVYLVGAAWGLRSRWHGVWLVPVSTLAAGLLVVLVATILTGSTGMCLE
jgi:hypothetical protein